MRPTRLLASLLVPPALLAGCADHAPTVPAVRPTRPNAEVTQTDQVVGFAYGGNPESNGYAILIGVEDVVAQLGVLCQNPSAIVTQSSGKSVFVKTPAGMTPLHSVSADANVVVLSLASVPPGASIFCALIGAPVVATGRVRYVLAANDSTGAGPGAQQIHVTLHGTVDLTAGGQANLFGEFQVVIRPDGSIVIDREVIRLTPL
jgi:hypothetical protein